MEVKYKFECKDIYHSDCFTSVIVSAIAYWRYDYLYMHAYNWSIQLTIEDGSHLKMLSAWKDIDRINFIQEIFGVKIYFKELCGDSNKLIEKINYSFKKEALIALLIDAYDCPWIEAYHMHHIKHWILLSGIDESINAIKVFDPFFEKLLVDYPLKQNFNGYCMVIEKGMEKHNINIKKVLKLAYDLYYTSNKYGKNSCQELLMYSDSLCNDLEVGGEWIRQQNLYKSKYFMILKHLKGTRKCFYALLQYCRRECEELDKALFYMNQVNNEWEIHYLKMYKYTKTLIAGDYIKEGIRIKKIAELETKVNDILYHIISDTK